MQKRKTEKAVDRDVYQRDTIAIAFVREAIICLQDRNIDATEVLKEVGIQPSFLSQPQARVSAASYGRLWRHIAVLLDDEFFGMDSHPMKTGSFALLCHCVIGAQVLEQALRRALHFLRVLLDDYRAELIRGEQSSRIVIRRIEHANALPDRAFAHGTFMLMVYGLACWLVGRRIPLLSVDFACAEPVFSDEWRTMFSPRLFFDQAETAICFESRYLQLPIIRDEASMRKFQKEAPTNLLTKFRNKSALYTRIRHHLHTRRPAEWPGFYRLAEHFGLSASTLRRRLKEEGQSYQSILDDLRRDMAVSLLSDTDTPIQVIAMELGFAESSTFHRAFRKWTGLQPSEFRQALIKGHA